MEMILNKISNFISRHTDNMTNEDKEIVSYGLELFFLKLFFFLTTVIISISMHCLVEGLVFTFFFSLLRSNSGGYHANTRIGCFIISILMFISTLILVNHIEEYGNLGGFIISFSVFSSIVIVTFAPLDTESNRLDKVEKKLFRRKSQIILGIEVVLAIILLYFKLKNLAYIIFLAIIETSILLVMELIKIIIKSRSRNGSDS